MAAVVRSFLMDLNQSDMVSKKKETTAKFGCKTGLANKNLVLERAPNQVLVGSPKAEASFTSMVVTLVK